MDPRYGACDCAAPLFRANCPKAIRLRASKRRRRTRDRPSCSDEQFETLLVKCAHKPRLHLYTLLLGETGGRCLSEALHLRWSDVDFADGFLEIRSERRRKHRTKGGKSRFVPITPRLLAAMKTMPRPSSAAHRSAGSRVCSRGAER
jgi:integrase